MTRPARTPRYPVTDPPAAVADVEPRNLRDHVVAAAQAVVDDLAHGRIASKQLANANVPGDLTALAQVGDDGPTSRDAAARLLHRHPADPARDMVAVGLQVEPAMYRSPALRPVVRDLK